ncbi:Lipoprotein-releasing system ATP-binding protein LolD [Paraburkholderia ribeironis]|uniref:Lipoprotein-releasing system ATP-binding protein LolD n=1 Tax=Paraburkholderia ribeironis TaxID=1247936 RepID=A0A1N7S7A1_9BURK|nr:ABC transporter ATP-binding protein [Paraburkholderia ribeironis]SIT43209.1 Lipoprotein-releasing system ATP-binding protein LolD [Paraburkholderia ribeironis]
MGLVELVGVSKQYALGESQVNALNGIDLKINSRDFLAIWGPSGSGKSSLLNLIGMVDKPSKGEVYLAGERVDQFDDDALAKKRNQFVGFIFQSFNLVPVLNAVENVMMPLQIRGTPVREAREIAKRHLNDVGLQDHFHKRPDQMSGGQRQRAAIARALAGSPSLVIADEPTANLDSDTSMRIIDLMRTLNQRDGVTFIFSTHDPRLLERVDNLIHLRDGSVVVQDGA